MKLHEWHRLLPGENFRPRMGLRQGNATQFFRATSRFTEVMRLRAAALDTAPEKYVAAQGESLPHVEEAIEKMLSWSGSGDDDLNGHSPNVFALCEAAGRRIEADWVLLSPDVDLHHPVEAGVVCFPSSWSLAEKIGLPIAAVHHPVPGMNESLGGAIDTFLERLTAEVAWERDNWGLSASAQLDQHPSQDQIPLGPNAEFSTVWLRWERQLLTRLPRTKAILFGIHVATHRLSDILTIPSIAPRLARALRTMSEPMAQYKGLAECRGNLIRQLASTD